jgi:hypothetical protein
MSIGNLKDYGNKGNNFPWQYKMLQGLDTLISIFLKSGGVPYLAPQSRITQIARVSAPGSYAGMHSMSIANVGTANGTVKGVTLKPGETVSFDAGVLNNTLDTVAYNATGTEFLIITVTS